MAVNQTPLARKYGCIYQDRQSGHERSALTPVAVRFPTIGRLATRDQKLHSITERGVIQYQRDLLHGYTTQELVYLDAISSRQLKTPNLLNGIHDVLITWEDKIPAGFTRKILYPVGEWNQWRLDCN